MEPYIASLPKREGPQVLRVSGNTYALYALRLCLTAFWLELPVLKMSTWPIARDIMLGMSLNLSPEKEPRKQK